MSSDQNWKYRLERWMPLFVFLFAIWYYCFRILGMNLEYIPGDIGDSRFIHFLLEHGYQWITGDVNEFWDAKFMYPFKDNIAFSDNMLGTLPIYSMYRMIGFGPESAYQFWWISLHILNYWICYWVLNKWFDNKILAIVGALIFTFSIFNIGQLNYLQMSGKFMIPIVIYAAFQLVDTGRVKYLFLYCFGIMVQMYCVMYLGLFLLYFSLGFLVLYAIVSKRYLFFTPLFKSNTIVYTIATFFIVGIGLSWILLPYLSMALVAGVPLYPEITPYLPTVFSFLSGHESSLLWGSIFNDKTVPNFWLHYNFIGLIPTVLLLLSPFILMVRKIRKNSHALIITLCLTILIILLLYLRTEDGFSLYKIVFNLPGMSSMKVLNRFLHIEIFFIILLLGFLFKKMPTKYSWLLLILCIFDNSFVANEVLREKKNVVQHHRLDTISELNSQDLKNYKAFAIIDESRPSHITHLDAMTASLSIDLPTINGYSSSCPGEFGEFYMKANKIGLLHWLKVNNIDQNDVLIIERN